MLNWFFLILLLLFTQIAKAQPKLIENLISHLVDNRQEEQLSLLENLVNINSGTANISGVCKLAEILRPKFEELGFIVHWEEEPTNMQRAGSLVALHPGNTGKKLLLIGHLDTVFPASSQFQHFERIGNIATGPGVIDDKGGDVVIIYALKALQSANLLADADITVVLTGDEEDSGKPTSISRKPLIDVAKRSDIALDFEWAITIDTATTARRGITNWMLTAEGNEAHSSDIFQEKVGFGAVYEISRILDSMRTQLANEQYLSFSPGLILGGTEINYDKVNSMGTAFGKGNVVAKSAMVKGDLRFLSNEQKINAEEKIKDIVNSHLLATKSSIEFNDGIPAMPPTLNNLKLLEKYSQASLALGYGEVMQLDPGSRGAGDISHIASFVLASLAGLGPVGFGAHSDKETLDISSLPIQTKRAALLIYWLTHEA
ncbi:MAG: peptidase M20 [Legionellales bacterium RIFCSPHIGHO2_12_FULL_35_11]|nr:MAG: peptidase M20 [Legionellales bacterium RIFCSPHIGHO2_12_FULL_35_11]